MAKRFTDTDKYKKPFLRGLQGAYKVLWDYLYHDCDHAGIWIKDFEIAQIYIGTDLPVNEQDALRYFNNGQTRVVPIDNGKKWFVPDFIEFQYGDLNEDNRAHYSVIKILRKYNLLGKMNKPLTRPLQGCKDKDKDKDLDKDKDIRLFSQNFEEVRKLYPGTKLGYQVEFDNFRKKFKDWKNILPLLGPAIITQMEYRESASREDVFVPEWKHFKTWINNRCWEEEPGVIKRKPRTLLDT